MTRLLYIREHLTEGTGALVLSHNAAYSDVSGPLERAGWHCVGVGYKSDAEACERARALYGAYRYRCEYCKRYKPYVERYDGYRLTKHGRLEFGGPLCPACAGNASIYDVKRASTGQRRQPDRRVRAAKEGRGTKAPASNRATAQDKEPPLPALGPLFLP